MFGGGERGGLVVPIVSMEGLSLKKMAIMATSLPNK